MNYRIRMQNNKTIFLIKQMLFTFLGLTVLSVFTANAQKPISINSILDSIQTTNPSLKMYDAEVRSLDEAAKGAKSWMAPELSSGFFMVPYAPRYWKSMDGQPGMGQYTIPDFDSH